MTFEQRQRAEEEIAAYLKRNTDPADPIAPKLPKVERLALFVGRWTIMANDCCERGDMAGVAQCSAAAATGVSCALLQRLIDQADAAA